MQTRLPANIVLIVLSRAPQQEPHAVYIFPRCHLRDQKLPTPSVSGRKPDISHLAACQVSHGKERDLPVSWHPCWQGQQSGKQDPLTHQGKPWGRVSKTPVRFFFFFQASGGGKKTTESVLGIQSRLFPCLQKAKSSEPSQGEEKRRWEGTQSLTGEATTKRRVGTGGLGWPAAPIHRQNVKMLSPQTQQSPALHTRQFEI